MSNPSDAPKGSRTKRDRIFDHTLIVGGGPAGLATALMLAKRGWTNITVLEQRPTADYYEADKSFNYLIDARGQALTDLLGLTDRLSQIGVPSRDFCLTQVKPDGSIKTSKLPVIDPNRKTAYWLTRPLFVNFLYQEIQDNWQEQIKVIFNAKCIKINKLVNGDRWEHLEVIAEINRQQSINFSPQLLVGCDGINSIVRQTLNEWEPKNSQQFAMKSFPSASTGLRYKVLTLPPSIPLDNNGNIFSESEGIYAITSQFKDRDRKISLGLLPVKDPHQPRTANIITLPEHQVWQLKTSEQAYQFLESSFPQIPIREIISTTEIERFVSSEGGSFPAPQYCPRLQYLLPSPPEKPVGIVLLGDTIHCFPPDIGQGVNSALQDVCVLHTALGQSNDNLSQALPLYESTRSPELEPLIRLVQTSFPWQYNQSQVGTLFWGINFAIRFLLSKLLPFVYSPPSFFLLQNHQLSYRIIWKKVQATTRRLYFLIFLLITALLFVGISKF